MNETVELSDYGAVLRRRWWLVVLGALLGLLAARFLLPGGSGDYVASTEVLVRSLAVDPLEDAVRIDTTVSMSTERQVAASAEVARLATESLTPAVSVADLRDEMSVQVRPDTEILVISVATDDPTNAKNRADVLAESYLLFRQQAAIDRQAFQIASLRERVTELSEQVAEANVTLQQEEIVRLTRDEVLRQWSVAAAQAAAQGEPAPPLPELPDLPAPEALAQATTNRDAAIDELSSLRAELIRLSTLRLDPGEVISVADLPESPTSSSALPALIGGLLVGAIAGAVVAFIVDRQQGRVYSPRELEASTRTPVLTRVRSGALSPGNPIMRTAPGAPDAHAFRRLAAAVLSRRSRADQVEVILVATPDRSEAHAMICANLALALVESGQNVVLVAGDRQRNDIDAIFELEGRPGLQQVLEGTREVGFAAVAHNLRVLPSGAPRSRNFRSEGPPLPVEATAPTDVVPSTARIDALLSSARTWADVILIDAPPALSFADGQVFAGVADSVIVAATAGRTEVADLEELRTVLELAGARVLGSVLVEAGRGARPTTRLAGSSDSVTPSAR